MPSHSCVLFCPGCCSTPRHLVATSRVDQVPSRSATEAPGRPQRPVAVRSRRCTCRVSGKPQCPCLYRCWRRRRCRWRSSAPPARCRPRPPSRSCCCPWGSWRRPVHGRSRASPSRTCRGTPPRRWPASPRHDVPVSPVVQTSEYRLTSVEHGVGTLQQRDIREVGLKCAMRLESGRGASWGGLRSSE